MTRTTDHVQGFTLIELVIVITVLGALSGFGFSIVFGSAEILMDSERRSGSFQGTRIALERVRRDVQSIASATATDITHMTASRFRFRTHEGVWVDYELDGTIFERNGTAFLENITALTFTYFGTGGTIAGSEDAIRRVAVRIQTQDGAYPVDVTAEFTLRMPASYAAWTELES